MEKTRLGDRKSFRNLRILLMQYEKFMFSKKESERERRLYYHMFKLLKDLCCEKGLVSVNISVYRKEYVMPVGAVYYRNGTVLFYGYPYNKGGINYFLPIREMETEPLFKITACCLIDDINTQLH